MGYKKRKCVIWRLVQMVARSKLRDAREGVIVSSEEIKVHLFDAPSS